MGKPSFRVLIIASAMLAYTAAADAAGLGKLTVLSELGRPLRAEIDVVALEKSELESLNARLASVDAYAQNNLPYPPPSLGLRLSLEKRASGETYISATTTQPVNEPFVDVLVELTWTGGRILRAYTALLDPPSYAEQTPAPHAEAAAPEMRPAPEVAPEPQVNTQLGSELQQREQTAEADVEPAPMELGTEAPVPQVAQQPAEAGMPAEPPAPAPPSHADAYTVERGDTLTRIAKAHKSEEVTLDQMLVALFRSNREAFSGQNMNRLKAGKVLQIPAADEITAVDVKEARREVHLQAADFHAYRDRLAAAAGSGTATTLEAGQSSAGAVTGMVQEKGASATTEPKEVLKLSRGEEPGTAAAAQQRVRALEEEIAAREKTIKEQTERVAKLEKTVKDMQALLDVKSKGMSDLQRQAAAQSDRPALQMPEPAAKPAEPTPAAPAAESHSAAGAAPAPSTATPATPETATAPAAEPAAAPKRPRVKVPPPPPEPSFADQLLDNPLYLAGGAAALGLLGFLGFRTARKRKESAYDESDEAEKKNLEVAPPAAAATRTDASGSMAAAARAAAPAQVTEEVDPLAEAEIYLAYGRDGQAEEILKEAAQNSPRRQEIQLKLLEIYAKRKDTAAFDAIARELYAATGGQGEPWLQAAQLGYALDPQNPRYAAGKPSGAAAASVSSLEEKLDFNIGLDDADTGTKTDIDLTRLGGAAGGTTTDIDLSNLGAPVTAAGIDLSTISGVPERTVTAQNIDVDLGAPAPEKKPSGLDFDFDLSGLSGGSAKPQPATQTSQMLDKALMQTVADVGEPGLGTIEFDLSQISLEAGPGKTEPTLDVGGSSPGMPEIDLSGINLDLGGGQGGPAGTATVAAKDDHWYDVQTKFDLAKAYQEMGDKEGAREILQEVIAEGDAEQQAAAKRVLETLA